MKSRFWTTAIICILISFFGIWAILEEVFYSLPASRVKVLGYQVAGILAFVGAAGIVSGIAALKKNQILAGVLIGLFLPPVLFALLVFIFGP
jgi:hypothetical protein